MPPKQNARSADERGRLFAPGIERGAGVVPRQVRLPSAGSMAQLEAWELVELLQRYGVLASFDKMRSDIMAKSAKLANLSGRLWEPELDRIATAEAKGELLGLARRTQENYTTALAVDGDETKLLIRLPEDYDPARICENCADLAGTIGTIEEQAAVGLPGSASCLGGDYCRCTLVEIE